MALPDAAVSYWGEQRQLSALTLSIAKRLWLRMGGDFDASWRAIAPTLIASIEKAQGASAELAADFVPAVLLEQGITAPADVDVRPESFVGVTGGGAPLESSMYAPVIAAKQAVSEGMTPEAALALAGDQLQMLVSTVLSDTGRAAESAGIASRTNVGYIRMLEGKSCPRCVILAGRWYRWSSGFQRHPRCDCRHLPTTRKIADDYTVDPKRYFESLSEAEQDRSFGKANAQAIRDGADMSQVVNAQKGMRKAQVYGQNLKITSEGVTKRGVAGKVIRARGRDPKTTPRLMPSAIYDIAENREDAVRLLRLNGYVVNRAGVPTSGTGSRTGLANIDTRVDLDRVVAQQDRMLAAKRATDTKAWLEAEQKYNRDVASWLAAERRYAADVTAWVAAEERFVAGAPARVISEAEGRASGVATWSAFASRVPKEDAELVRVYTGNGYEDINGALRAGDVSALSATKRDTIAALDRTLDRAPRVPEKVTVSRAVGANVFGLTRDTRLSTVLGKPFHDDAFMSTAHQSRLSSVERHEVEVRLDVPAGTKALYVSSHDVGDPRSLAAFGPDENELILDRGMRYEFTDAFVEDGRRVLVGRITGRREKS